MAANRPVRPQTPNCRSETSGCRPHLLERRTQPGLQPAQVLAHRPAAAIQGDDRIDTQLPGRVQHAASAPAHPAHGELLAADLFVGQTHVASRPVTADRQQTRMLAAQDGDPRLGVAPSFVDQSPLQSPHVVPRDATEQVELGHPIFARQRLLGEALDWYAGHSHTSRGGRGAIAAHPAGPAAQGDECNRSERSSKERRVSVSQPKTLKLLQFPHRPR